MDIFFSSTQNAYRHQVRDWLSANLPDNWNQAGHWPRLSEAQEQDFLINWERRIYAAGYSGISWPKEYGGQGRDHFDELIVNEELGRSEAPESINTIGRELVGPILLSAGTEEQKRHYIPRVLQMEDVWCQGFSEPNAGSDLAAIKTRAVKRDDGRWVIDGQKIWTSYAHFATHCILLARTNLGTSAYRGMSLFIVRMDTPGVEVRPIRHINGQPHFNEVFLTGVVVEPEMLIGPVDSGWMVAVEVLGFERATTRQYRQARFLEELRVLVQHVRGSGELSQALQAELGDIASELSIMRYHNLRFVSRISQGGKIGEEASLLKLLWSQIHQRIARLGLEVLGSEFDAISPIAERFRRIYFTARGETIYAGSSQIQRNIIAERVLGLPRGEKRTTT
ncbi:acyl-CoA dehydrogenase family protein [Microvirga antarctica]|uniref:acyl-CoA dehydrogenase family protein n=1 Tax=Microvirga antarctica TaxID=2819233 RepID=UPI001B311DF5|nr:acyl-CoA dehydrogenase family protein [Microvirga antarctica]